MPTERHTLHFDFSRLDPDADYTFHAALTSVPLSRHTSASRATARAASSFLRLVPDRHLTHFAHADLPSDGIVMTYVTNASAPVHLALHVPREGLRAARARNTHWNPLAAAYKRLARFSVDPSEVSSTFDPADYEITVDDYQDTRTAAMALLYHHPNLINLNSDTSIPGHIVDACIRPAVEDNQDLTDIIEELAEGWLVTQQLPVPGSQPPATVAQTVPAPDVVLAMTGTLQEAVTRVQNSAMLRGQAWNYEPGSTSSDYGATSGEGAILAADTGEVTWTVASLTSTNGLSIDPSSVAYTAPSGTDSWIAIGLWSQNNLTNPLTAALAAQVAAGNVYVIITTAANPNGALQGQLVQSGTLPDGSIQFVTTLLPVGGATGSGSGTFVLNSGSTGLIYYLTAQGLSVDAAVAAFNSGPAGSGPMILGDIALGSTSTGTLTINCTNTWLRHLGAYAQYLDASGNVLTPPATFPEQLSDFLQGDFESDPTKKYVGLVGPVTTVFGVPIPADPTTLTIPIWDEVGTVRLFWGGLGRGTYDGNVCGIGITVTVVAELVLPVFLLYTGVVAGSSATVKSIIADKEVLAAICTAGFFLVSGGAATDIATSQDPSEAAAGLAERFGPMLLSPVTSLGIWVAKQVSIAAAEKAAPFADVAIMVIDGAVTAVELAQTIIEVLDSPFYYSTDITRTFALTVTLTQDPTYNKFPDYHDHYQVSVLFDNGATLGTFTADLPSTTLPGTIPVSFPSLPAAGNFSVIAVFYAANGWASGNGQSAWQPAQNGPNGPCAVSIPILINTIPLNDQSVFIHNEVTGMQDGSIQWLAAVGDPPTDTPSTPSPYPDASLVSLVDITMAQFSEQIGYSYQAIGLDDSGDTLYAVQNLSTITPQDSYAASEAMTLKPGIVYNIASSDDGTGANYFLDSTPGEFDPVTNPAGGVHLRQVSLTLTGAPSFATGTNQSWGRFPFPVDRYVFHPQGWAFGISFNDHKLFRLELPDAASADASAPLAAMASGKGDRYGLMDGPVGIALALDGRLLVLEAINNRVQAFNIHGKPVPYFKNPDGHPGDELIPVMALQSTGANYLDLSVESKGYIFVLYFLNDGSSASDYNVDLYTPDGTFMVTTPNVAAANIVVDILRNLYTLNYQIYLDANGLPQPSVSMWLPPAPPPLDESQQ